jgi:sigma-B regulation protein RsbU (phosphoserine phosphatase)
MKTLGAVLAAYGAASGRDAALWEWRTADRPPHLLACSDATGAVCQDAPPDHSDAVSAWACSRGWRAIEAGSPHLPAWLILGARNASSRHASSDDASALDEVVATVVAHLRRLIRERDGATRELAERYEEISLLYAIGELLGSGASVESVAYTVLRELAQTVGAPRGALMLHDPARDELYPAALLGIDASASTIVSARDASLLASRAFQSGEAYTEVGGDAARIGAPLLAADGGPVLAVPIRRSTVSGGASLGAVLLAGRQGDAPFTAGDRKLVTAIASQVGTALHNARLVRAALEQEQLAREMRLAHEMQLKLLPPPRVVGPEARAAARVVPAESVGGDFYLLARLDADRTGVVIGDVSGHGYQAALVMALAMSATAIHVQAVIDPAVALEAVRRSLDDELESTEMSITLFYGVIDSASGTLRFANAGHPHAFVLRADGSVERLEAQAPPLGFAQLPLDGAAVPWGPDDRLLLFTDGVPDARNASGERLGERAVLDAAVSALPCRLTGGARDRTAPACTMDAIYDAVRLFAGETPFLDDLAVVVVDRGGEREEAAGSRAVSATVAS